MPKIKEGYVQAPPNAVQIELCEGCQLRCDFCFGISDCTRMPWLSMATGPKRQLKHVREGDVILTFDDDMKIVETTISKVFTRTVDSWLSITIGKQIYDVTPEHPFFTNRGLVQACNLVVGDHILEAKFGEIIAWKKSGSKNPMKNKEVAAKRRANTNYKEIGRKISQTIREKQEAGTYTHSYETLSAEKFAETRSKLSETKRRENNPNWNGKNGAWLDLEDRIKSGDIKCCERCGAKNVKLPVCESSLLIHHKDEDHSNNDPANLEVLCHPCHDRHHEREQNFTKNKAAVKAHNGRLVKKIEQCSGKLKVKNLKCFPYNTFLADGMWVHNCGLNAIRGKENNYKFASMDLLQTIATGILEAGWHPRIEFAMHGEPTWHPKLLEAVALFRTTLPKSHLMMTSNGGGLMKSPTELIDGLLEHLNVLALDAYENVNIVPRILEKYDGRYEPLYYPKEKENNPHKRRKRSEHLLIIVQDIETATKGTHSTLNNHAGSGAPPNDSGWGKRCAKPFRELSVRWDGNVAICCNDWTGSYKCGNVLETPIDEIWSSPPFQAARKALYHGLRDVGPCAGCDAISYRPGLLPDHMGADSLPSPSAEDRKVIAKALEGQPYTTPVLRPWQLQDIG